MLRSKTSILVILGTTLLFYFAARTFDDKSYLVVTGPEGNSPITGIYFASVSSGAFAWSLQQDKKTYLPDIYEISYKGKDGLAEPGTIQLARDRKLWYIYERFPGDQTKKTVALFTAEAGQSAFYPPKAGWRAVPRDNTREAKNLAAAVPGPIITYGGPTLLWELEVAGGSNKGSNKQKNIRELLATPVTLFLLIVNAAAGYKLWADRVPVDRVSFSVRAFVEEQEYWRAITASFSHFDLMHIGFNLLSLYNLKAVETVYGPWHHLCLTAVLVVGTMLTNAAAGVYIWKARGQEAQRNKQAVGFSCVLFSYMVIAAVRMKEFCPIPGFSGLCFKTYMLGQFSFNAGPFVLLVLTHFIMPRASFIGHLSGIIWGYLAAWGLLSAVTPPMLCALCGLLALAHHGPALGEEGATTAGGVPCRADAFRPWSSLPDARYYGGAEARAALPADAARAVCALRGLAPLPLAVALLGAALAPPAAPAALLLPRPPGGGGAGAAATAAGALALLPAALCGGLALLASVSLRGGRHPEGGPRHRRAARAHLLALAALAAALALEALASLPALWARRAVLRATLAGGLPRGAAAAHALRLLAAGGAAGALAAHALAQAARLPEGKAALGAVRLLGAAEGLGRALERRGGGAAGSGGGTGGPGGAWAFAGRGTALGQRAAGQDRGRGQYQRVSAGEQAVNL